MGGTLIILVGVVTWSLTMVKSGLLYDYGYGFWGANGHDGIWHLALSKSLAQGETTLPIFAGETIKNYHFGFNIFLVLLHKISFIPLQTLYFQILPPLFALGIGVACYLFVYEWKSSKRAAIWATFFVYMGGNWGWVVSLIKTGTLGGESVFWSQQSISTLINPPFAFSILILFLGLYFLVRGVKSGVNSALTIATFLFGILISIKVYAGLLVLGGLFVTILFIMIFPKIKIAEDGDSTSFIDTLAQLAEIRFNTKIFRLTKVFLGAFIISLFVFLPFNSGAAASIEFNPFWFLDTMMLFSDRLGWVRFGEALAAYKSGGIWWKLIPAYVTAFIIFWYGNMGTRILNEVYFAKRFIEKRVDFIDIFFASVILTGGVIPLFFVQKGTPWNTIQFFYYTLLCSGVLAGIVFGEWIENQKNHSKTFVIFALILLTIPTTYATLKNVYVTDRPPAKLSTDEIEALDYLAEQPEGVVIAYPYNSDEAQKAIDNPPRPLYLYESTAYVAAFSGKDVYLEDEVNLSITGYPWEGRRSNVEQFFKSKNVESFVRENDIRYIYLVGSQRDLFSHQEIEVEKIFENNEVDIYEITHSSYSF